MIEYIIFNQQAFICNNQISSFVNNWKLSYCFGTTINLQLAFNDTQLNINQAICQFQPQALSAYKYLRSISQTALLYHPIKIKHLTSSQNLADRVVQAFFDTSNIHIKVTEAQTRLKQVKLTSSPSHSFYQISLPFEENLRSRQKMVQFMHSYIRVGHMLELMDYIASNVAYRYCSAQSDKNFDFSLLEFIIVTAAIDSIQFYYPISVQLDCVLSGYVSYVGKSSMEVHIDVLQVIQGAERLACSTNFVMGARSKKTGKAHEVPSMDINNEKDVFRIINQLGNQRQTNRKRYATRGLEISPPSYEESVIIHKLKHSIKDKPQNCVPISSNSLKNTVLMHIEDKNLSGKVFRGLIFKLGYLLGWLCASKFLKTGYPVIARVDDVLFLAPVQIGTYIELQARLGYVTEKFIHVIIMCTNYQISGKSMLKNVLRVTYQHGLSANELVTVYPETLDESYLYIQSLRRVQRMTSIDI